MSAPMARICLVNGVHRPGSQWERECPLRNAAKRSERSRKAAQTRYAPRQRSVASSEGVDSGSAGYGSEERPSGDAP